MYSNSDGRFSVHTCGDYQDQWWYLEVERASNDDYYRIKNKESGRCIISNSDGRFNVWTCHTYTDQYWTFDQTKSDDVNYFQIKNLQSKLRIIINDTEHVLTYHNLQI